MKKFSLVLILGILLTPLVWAQNEPLRLICYDYREGKFDGAGNLIEKGEISELIEKALSEAKAGLDEIARLPHESRTFQNTPEAIEHVTAKLVRTVDPILFMKDVSTNSALRKEAALYDQKVQEFMIQISLRKDLYEAFQAFQKNMGNDFSTLDSSQQRLIELMVRDFKKSGVWLQGEKLEELRALKIELAKLETEFSQNLNENTDTLLFTPEELEGVPRNFLEGLKRKEGTGRYIMPVKIDYYVPVMENAICSETRKRMYMAWVNRAVPENLDLLARILEIRTHLAHLLGYATWLDHQTDGRMAKNAETVKVFLDSLREKLTQKTQEDLGALVALKREMTGDPTASSLEMWEKEYYANQLKKRLFSFDPEAVREYFPVHRVIKGTFEIYSKLLGILVQEVKNADVWQEGVKLLDVLDARTHEHLGYFFMDLFPRQGKYNHFAAFGLVQAGVTADGTYQRPVASIVANFTRPSDDGRPSLLSHGEVETFFHEFGHIMKQMLSQERYASYSGNAVARDFVEAPSQMLENWVWNSKVLDILSGHYKDESQKLPQHLREGLLASARFNTGVLYSRQLFYAMLDCILHTASPKDMLGVASRLAKEITGIALPAGGERFLASFGHVVGYSGGYYGYLYSEVYAQAMWEMFEQGGILSEEVGMRYRRSVLEHGGDRPHMEAIREFIGGDPTPEAFFRKIGLKGDSIPLRKTALRETLAKIEIQFGLKEGERSGKVPVFSEGELSRLSEVISREYVDWVRQNRGKRNFTYRKAFHESATRAGCSEQVTNAILTQELLARLRGVSKKGESLSVARVSKVILREFQRTLRR